MRLQQQGRTSSRASSLNPRQGQFTGMPLLSHCFKLPCGCTQVPATFLGPLTHVQRSNGNCSSVCCTGLHVCTRPRKINMLHCCCRIGANCPVILHKSLLLSWDCAIHVIHVQQWAQLKCTHWSAFVFRKSNTLHCC